MSTSTPDEEFEALAAGMPPGQRALEAVVFYRACDLPVPAWALEEIEDCYTDFKLGARASGWTHPAKKADAPRTLGDAFGMNDNHLKGKQLHARRLRAVLGARVLNCFHPIGEMSRTEANYEKVGDLLGISPSEVDGMLRRFGKESS